MKVAHVSNLVLILWLSLAALYWKNSHSVNSHNPWECLVHNYCKSTLSNVISNQTIRVNVNNVHLCCCKHKSEHYQTQRINNHEKKYCDGLYLSRMYAIFSFSSTNYHIGPPIKWWEDIGREVQRSKTLLNTIKIAMEKSLQICSKNLIYDALHRFSNMAETSSTKNIDVCVVEENEIINSSQKRTSTPLLTITQKKAKNKKSLGPNGLSLWLGFPALNLVNKQKELPRESIGTTRELMKKGIDFDEAKEMQNALPSFPFVPQMKWPSKREDGIEGQHFNLTQLPFDVEVDENGFSFDYQVSIYFELKKIKLEKDIIMGKVKERLAIMKIKTGELIGEPIAIMCYHKSTTWSGSIKLHLDNPVVDAKGLLQGTKAFILTLDEEKPWRGKVCKSYDMLALNNLLSVKITSDTLIGKEWFKFFEDVVNEGFDRKYDYEVTNIQKIKK